jgi:Zn-dependent protease
MLRTLPGIFISLCLISLSMYLSLYSDDQKTQNDGHILFFVSIILYLAFFSIGFSSTIWTVNSEIYPIHLVSTGVSLATATNWLSNFAVASVFLSSMEADGGKVFTFLILAFFTICAFLFIFFLLPETAGKRIEENVKNILEGEILTNKKDK